MQLDHHIAPLCYVSLIHTGTTLPTDTYHSRLLLDLLFILKGKYLPNKYLFLIFIQLCWMARDMSLKVRLEAFIALGKVRLVSEGVLVQSLSKKILENKIGGSSVSEYIIKESKCPLSSAAGAFVHGIEDEFHEVPTILYFAENICSMPVVLRLVLMTLDSSSDKIGLLLTSFSFVQGTNSCL